MAETRNVNSSTESQRCLTESSQILDHTLVQHCQVSSTCMSYQREDGSSAYCLKNILSGEIGSKLQTTLFYLSSLLILFATDRNCPFLVLARYFAEKPFLCFLLFSFLNKPLLSLRVRLSSNGYTTCHSFVLVSSCEALGSWDHVSSSAVPSFSYCGHVGW